MKDNVKCYEDDTEISCSRLQEDQFMYMDKGELISEILQIAACLDGTVSRVNTLNSVGYYIKVVKKGTYAQPRSSTILLCIHQSS